MITCRKCKTENKDGSKFCKKCGLKLIKTSELKPTSKKLINVEQNIPVVVKRDVNKEKIEGGLFLYNNEKLEFLVLVRISLIFIFGLAGILLLLSGSLASLVYLFIFMIWTPKFSIKSKSLNRNHKIFISLMLLLLISPFQYETLPSIFMAFIFLVFILYIIKALKSKK